MDTKGEQTKMTTWSPVTRDTIPSLHYENAPRELFNIHLISRLYLLLGLEASDQPEHRNSNCDLQTYSTGPTHQIHSSKPAFPWPFLLSSHYFILFFLFFFFFPSPSLSLFNVLSLFPFPAPYIYFSLTPFGNPTIPSHLNPI